MRDVNVTELKAHLSKYLRMASRGVRIIVKDRDQPVAQLGPLEQKDMPWHERLVHEGRLRPGTQNWAVLKVSRLNRRVDIQRSLRDVREE